MTAVRCSTFLVASVAAVAPATADAATQPRFAAAAERAKAAMLADPLAAAEAARRAEPLAAAMPDAKRRHQALAEAYWLQAEAYFRVDRLNRAAPLIGRAFEAVRSAARASKLEADILLTRGSINGKLMHVAEALHDFQAAHRLFRTHRDTRREAIALICIANLYFDANDFDAALRYLSQALDAHQADPGLAQAILNTQGVALQELKQFDKAHAAFRQALLHARELQSAALQATILRNMARNQLAAGQVSAAERTLATARRASSSGEGITQLESLAAQAALQRGDPRSAGRLIERAFFGVDLGSTDGRFRYAHLTAVAAYRALRQPEQALTHLAALKRLDDKATKLATETSNALMAARFDSANQEVKIERLRDAERLRVARDALERAKSERKLFLLAAAAVAVVIVLLLISLVAIRRSRDRVRAANDGLAVTNDALGKALAAKTEFLATTSHEIRTPLNGILGMTQVMLADEGVTGPVRDRLNVVHGAGLTMRALVDDILDVAKMETGNLGLECAPFDLPACLHEAAAIWAEQARGKGLSFDIDLTDCPPFVEGDAARVRQILFNLLSNAIKFTVAGGVSVVVRGEADGVSMTVTDTGIGIPANQQRAVFDSFRQADASTTRRFGGTGLGLSICRSLARAMGGDIALDSREGEGSRFTVRLPLRACAAAPTPAIGAAPPTLLIVDRNPITRAMFRSLFAPYVPAVSFAATAEEVEAELSTGTTRRILIDDATARAGGDANAFVARVAAAAGTVPVTLLWPVAAAVERDELLALGVTQVVAKPVTGAALVQALFASETETLVSRAA